MVYIGDIQPVPKCQFTQIHMMPLGDINMRQRNRGDRKIRVRNKEEFLYML